MSELIEILKPDFKFGDERGSLVQIVHEGYTQINIARSVSGAVRGNHFHAENRETFYVVEGKFRLEVHKKGSSNSEKYVFGNGDMFIINKGVVHTFTYIDDSLLVVMYDKGILHKDGSKDIIIE